MYINENSNPLDKRTGDCVIRALAEILQQSWERTYIELCLQGFIMADLPNSNDVWQAYLHGKGFRRYKIYDQDPEIYTVEDFCEENPEGRYVLAIKGHVVAIVNGKYVDAWDSGGSEPLYVWRKGGHKK